MIRRVACLFVIALILSSIAAAAAQDASKEKAAVAAAEKWLGMVDKGECAESWKQAATYFRNSVTGQKWEQAAESVRKPLDRLISRRLKTAVYKASLPGAPDGEYVVMQFDSSFANKKLAVETVSTVLDKDGKWRVVGYFIR
ncbi:MAG TPA: DUF4019 domain-containing protein [Terriglobia bacterium]|nr:DUF4019 domain-containing protein [Terriglobia bacterium]